MPEEKGMLEKHIRTIRLIAEHRESEAEKKLIKDFSKCVSDINGFLGNEYAKYAENDELTSEILHQKGEYARFIEEVINKYDNITLETRDTIQSMVEQTYKLCYDGMVEAVAKSNRAEDLHKALQAIQATTPEVIKKSVENPIPKLRLNPVMERNRKKVISGIKREITTGLSLGDRMSTMAGRISKQVNLGYTQSMLIARTEGHRVREGGFNDAAQRTNEVLKENDSEYRMVKIWKTMKDGAVRRVNKHNSADHAVMDGQIVPQDEKFILSDGSKADCPGSSGVAAQDCNCRCYISREIMNDEEYFKATGRHFEEENEQKPLTKDENSGIIEENSNHFEELSLSDLEKFENWQNDYYECNKSIPFSREDNPFIYKYSGGSYEAINAIERGGESLERAKRCFGDLKEYIEDGEKISEELSKFKLNTPIKLRRSVENVDYITGATSSVEDMKKCIGKTYLEKGFTSTTICSDTMLPFGGFNNPAKTTIEIYAPKATRGAYIYKISEHPAEFEFLIDRNTKYRILDAGERTVKVKDYKGNIKEEVERFIKMEVMTDV